MRHLGMIGAWIGLAALTLLACGGGEEGPLPPLGISFFQATDANGCATDSEYDGTALPSSVSTLKLKLYSHTGALAFSKTLVVMTPCASDSENCVAPGASNKLVYNVPTGTNMHLTVEAYSTANVLNWVGDNYDVDITTQKDPSTDAAAVHVYMRRVGAITPSKCMPENLQRFLHTATVLRNGRDVLITGGILKVTPDGCAPKNEPGQASDSSIPCDLGQATTSVMLYNMQTGEFKALASMQEKRAGHQAILLADGRVLIIGGASYVNILTAQNGRAFYESGTLNNGATALIANAELYNPDLTTTSEGGGTVSIIKMQNPRMMFTTTPLDTDGTTFLLAGGWSEDGRDSVLEKLSYNPANGDTTPAFTVIGTMLSPRVGHTATAVSGGRVLLFGGAEPGQPVAEFYTAEGTADTNAKDIFSDADTWPNLYYHATAVYNGGKSVLITGGMEKKKSEGTGAETLGEPQANSLLLDLLSTTATKGLLNKARAFHQMAIMPDGAPLVLGGVADFALTTSVPELEYYDLGTKAFLSVTASAFANKAVTLTTPRFAFTMNTLKDGSLLLIGGANPSPTATDGNNKDILRSGEIYYPDAKLFPAGK